MERNLGESGERVIRQGAEALGRQEESTATSVTV